LFQFRISLHLVAAFKKTKAAKDRQSPFGLASMRLAASRHHGTVEALDACFVIKDASRQKLASDEERGVALTRRY